MKKSKLFYSLAILTSLVACNNTTSSSSTANSSTTTPSTSSVVSTNNTDVNSSTTSTTTPSTSTTVSTVTPSVSTPSSSSTPSVSTSTSSSTPSVSTPSSSSTPSVSTPSSSSTPSVSTPSSSVTPEPEKVDLLKDLKEGFVVRSSFAKTYNTGTPSVTLIETSVASGIAKWKQFSGSAWDSVAEDAAPYKVFQYENVDGDAKIVTEDTAGNPIYEPLMLKDVLTGQDVEAFWSETNLDNAFAKLSNEDFVRQDDGTYALDLSEDKLSDEDYAATVKGLGIQMYMVLEGYSTHTFIEQALTSYVITVDENNVPASYVAEFETVQQDDGFGGVDNVYRSISGTFVAFGNDVVAKIGATEAKYPELDAALANLKKHNYEFNIVRTELGDGMWTSDSSQTITGKSDGNGNFEVHSKQVAWGTTETKFGYKQVSENSYRQYTIGENSNLWAGEAVEGSALSLLPSFPFSSAVFEQVESSEEGKTVYAFQKPELLNTEYSTDKNIVNVGLGSIGGWSLVDLTITVSENAVVFENNTSASRNMVASFTNLGGVAAINASADELSDLVAGRFIATNIVKGTEMTFDVTISNDGVFAITKDGASFGSYGYTINTSNQLVLDSAIETKLFQVTEVTGEGDAAKSTVYNCNINRNVKVDDPFNPSKITFEVKACEEGKTWGSTTKFEGSRFVEPDPTYYFEFTLPDWSGTLNNVALYYWGQNASCSWPGDAMTLVEGTTATYCVEVNASVVFDGIIISFEQNGTRKQSKDITENLPTEPGKYEIVSLYQNWEGDKFGGVSINQIKDAEPTYMKDSEDSYVVGIYYDLYDYLLGAKADYIPFVAGIESCVDIIWTDENPEGFFYEIASAPEGYAASYAEALVNVYGYTKESDTVFVNNETGLKITLAEDSGYQYIYTVAL